MPQEIYANDATTTVTSGGTTAPAGGTVQTWTVASSASFPAASSSSALPTQFHVADAIAGLQSELIAVTNVSGTTWTVTRGAEGTTPLAHTAGFTIWQVQTAGGLTAASDGVYIKVPAPTGVTATDTPAVVAAITTLTGLGGNATLLFGDGVYQVDSNALVIRSCSNFAVKGTGGTMVSQAPNRAGQVSNVTGDLLIIADCADFRAEDITFDGLRDTVAPMTPLTASATSGQPSVTVASGNGARYLPGQSLFLFGGLGTSDQNKSEGFANAGAVTPLVISSITAGGGSGGGDLVTFTANLANSYTQISSTSFSDGYGPYAYAGAYLTPYQAGSATVAGRTLAGEDQQNGLHLISCKRFTVSHIEARNVWESPIRLGTGYETTSLTDGCQQGTVSDCVTYHGYDQGIAVWVCQSITVKGCVANAAGWAGISLTASDYCTVTGNQIISSIYRVPGDTGSGSGVVTEGGLRNQITKNIITSPYQYGIAAIHSPLQWGLVTLPTTSAFLPAGTAGGTSIQVSSTTGMAAGALYSLLDGPGTEAVTVSSVVDGTHVEFAETISFSHASGTTIGARVAQENVIEGNTIHGAGSQGIMLIPSARSVVKNNTLTAGSSQGLVMDYTLGFRPTTAYPCGDGTHAEGNVIGNGGGAGIRANGVSRLLLRGNQVYSPNSNGGGIELHGVTDSAVSQNRVTDIVGAYGIVVENGGPSSTASARLAISGNVIERIGDLPGLSVQTGDSLTITANEIRSCAGTAGMYLQGITRSVIAGNICNSNAGAGIELDDNGSVYSLYNRVTGNTTRDDGTGLEISFGGAGWTQQHGIVETGHSNSNLIYGNETDSNAVDQLTTTGAATGVFANIISGAVTAPVYGYSTAEPLASGEAIFARIAANGATTLTTQTITLSYWTAVTSGSATAVTTATQAPAAAGLTYAAIGVYSVAANGNLTLLGSTGDLHATLWASTYSSYTPSLAFTRVAGQRYALGVLAVGTTMPALSAASDYFTFNPIPPVVFGSVPGQSTMPSSISSGSIGTSQSGGAMAVVAP